MKRPLKERIAIGLISALIALFRRSYRIRVFGSDHRKLAEGSHPHGSFVLALWHEYLLAGILTHAGQKIAPLASLSSDGEIVSQIMDRLGYSTVRGSSHRGGTEARDELVEKTMAGWFTAVTVDGPRGPRRRVKGGVVDVARRTGAFIVPLVCAADREWVLTRTWDHFRIPKPFARIAVQYGEPVPVDEATHGIAFGTAKQSVREKLERCEVEAREQIATWTTP